MSNEILKLNTICYSRMCHAKVNGIQIVVPNVAANSTGDVYELNHLPLVGDISQIRSICDSETITIEVNSEPDFTEIRNRLFVVTSEEKDWTYHVGECTTGYLYNLGTDDKAYIRVTNKTGTPTGLVVVTLTIFSD